MENKQFIIWIGAILLIILTKFLYDTYIKPVPVLMSKEEIEIKLAKAISLSQQINNDDSLSVMQKSEKQSEVNELLQELKTALLDIDANNQALSRELESASLKVYQKQLDHLLNLVLAQWKEHNLTLNDELQTQLKYIWTQSYSVTYSKPLEKTINHAILQLYNSTNSTPEWLIEIDRFFLQTQKLKDKPFMRYSAVFSEQYSTLLALSLPFVSFDQIIRLKSLDDDYLHRNELVQFSQFDIPRDADEATAMYHAILDLPKSSKVHSFIGELSSDQAFKAQMMTVVLMQNHSDNRALLMYQKTLAESAPDYLFDYPDHGIDPRYSSRPAFWMAYSNVSDETLELIAKRSTAVFKKDYEEVKIHKQKKQKFEQIVASESPEDNRTITQRVDQSQMELATLLETFDKVMQEHDIILPASLNDDQIEKLKKYFAPVKLPDAYITLYKWHNGFPSDFYYLEIFQPIVENLFEYDLMQTYGEWDKKWFPLRSFNGDTYWLVNLEAEQSSAVFYSFIEDGSFEKEYKSIKSMIELYLKAINDGILYYDQKKGNWEMDETRFEALKQNKNL